MRVNVDAFGHLPRIEDEAKRVNKDIELACLKSSLYRLKRISKRMRMKSVRLLQITRKAHNIVALARAETWEYAAGLLDEEITAIHNQIKRLA